MAKQFTIIDGYNLLHTCGFIRDRIGPGTLEKARDRLLGIIARFVKEQDRNRMTVVFDSRESGLPNRLERHGVLVEFASEYEDADQLIEQLIQKHSAVRQLTVVSSDHRLHKAARARGAAAIDSEEWLDQIQERPDRTDSNADSPDHILPEKPVAPASSDVSYWVDKMDLDDLDLTADQPSAESDPRTNQPVRNDKQQTNEDLGDELDGGNPFPPGYADDLFE